MQELQKSDVKRFVLAGNATVTLESGKTGKHFTYKISQCKNDDRLFFVRLLRGADNENDYTYIGCYYDDSEYFHPARQYQNTDTQSWPKSLRAIYYLMKHLDDVPDSIKVYHEGRCGRCGRKLTTPESIKLGLGPECAKCEVNL